MNSVSPINQKYIVAQSTQQVEKPAEQNQTEKKHGICRTLSAKRA